MALTFEEFRKLPRAEQNRRERELSNHDRFLARMNDWGGPDGPHDDVRPLMEDEVAEIMRIFHKGNVSPDK